MNQKAIKHAMGHQTSLLQIIAFLIRTFSFLHFTLVFHLDDYLTMLGTRAYLLPDKFLIIF